MGNTFVSSLQTLRFSQLQSLGGLSTSSPAQLTAYQYKVLDYLMQKFPNLKSSQFTVKGDPRVHRVVYLNYRVGKRDLSYPRPQVDLTTREVSIPAPEPEPRRPRRGR